MLRATVVIPTFNRRPSLLEVLNSLARQTAPPDRFEVVVVLDGCTDDSESWLRRHRPPFELRWCWQENGGLAAARNRGAREARHQVLIFLDDDVTARPDLVAAHLRAHEEKRDLIVQGYMPIPPAWRRKGAALLYSRSYEETIAELPHKASGSWHLWSGNMSVRRDTFERIGGFDLVGFRRYGGGGTGFWLRAR